MADLAPLRSGGRGQRAQLLGEPWGDTSRVRRPYAKDPSVIAFDGRYLLYFSLPPAEPAGTGAGGWGIGIAESSDLFSWRTIAALPRSGDYDARGRAAPGAVVLHGRVHLFFQTYGNGAGDAICHASSEDGLRFTPAPDNPVFAPRGDWTCGRAIDADVVPFQDRLLLGYATRDPDFRVQSVGFAAAPLDSDFGRDSWRQLSTDGPALFPQLPWEWDCIEAPALCVRDGHLVAFYAGGYNNEPQQIGVATSSDGVGWTKLSEDPWLTNGRPGEWNSSESGHPGLLLSPDGASHLFLQGNDDGGQTWRIAGLSLEWDGMRPRVGQPVAPG